MKLLLRLAVVIALVSAPVLSANAAESPTNLIVGKWLDRAQPNDATIEFAGDGTGQIVETTPTKTTKASVTWKIENTFGNACIVVITYDGAPPGVGPLTWLLAFDGADTFVVEPAANKIVFMDRQK